MIFIITAYFSNGANLTDGIDGLAAGTSAVSVFALGNIHIRFRKYNFLKLPQYYVYPHSGEMICIYFLSFVGER